MALFSPTKKLFFFSLILVAIGVGSQYYYIEYVSTNAIWAVLAGYVVLATGTVFSNA